MKSIESIIIGNKMCIHLIYNLKCTCFNILQPNCHNRNLKKLPLRLLISFLIFVLTLLARFTCGRRSVSHSQHQKYTHNLCDGNKSRKCYKTTVGSGSLMCVPSLMLCCWFASSFTTRVIKFPMFCSLSGL